MRALNTVMAPLRASAKNRIAAWRDSLDDLSLAKQRLADAVNEAARASRTAVVPYVENIHDGYATAGRYARARAQRLVEHPPKALRILANRYVLISLAAGACYIVIRRLRERRQAKPVAAKARARRPQARTPGAARRKANGGTRGAQVH